VFDPGIFLSAEEYSCLAEKENSSFSKAALKIKVRSDDRALSFPWGRFPGGPASANPILPAVVRDGSSTRPSSPRSRPMSSPASGKKDRAALLSNKDDSCLNNIDPSCIYGKFHSCRSPFSCLMVQCFCMSVSVKASCCFFEGLRLCLLQQRKHSASLASRRTFAPSAGVLPWHWFLPWCLLDSTSGLSV
jgi:hypothetical protein